jgi:hypothetical protein
MSGNSRSRPRSSPARDVSRMPRWRWSEDIPRQALTCLKGSTSPSKCAK